VLDGEIVAAEEEERFRRIKHWAGFPSEAIRYCLAEIFPFEVKSPPESDCHRMIFSRFGGHWIKRLGAVPVRG
jgi:predicted NodU family carbamoyl transferase